MKKMMSSICALALFISAIPFAACSNEVHVNYTLGEDGAHYIVSGVSGNKRALKKYEIPSYYCEQEGGELLPVTEIGDDAFNECIYLNHVILPDTIEVIGANAFKRCPFDTFTIPEGVTTIGNGAFRQCGSLTEIVIPESVVDMQDYAFAYCPSLKKAVIKGNITYLPYRVFYNSYSVDMLGGSVYTSTALVSIYLPATLEKIHISALDGNYIADIYFAGSEQQWDKVYFYQTEKEEGEDGEMHEVENKVEGEGGAKPIPSNVKIHFNVKSE